MADNTASYSRSAPSGWLRSAAKLSDLWPRARIASLVSSAGRRFPWHATDAPASASATAIAAPSPVAEPVTSASFPSRRNLSRIPIVYRSVFFGVASRLSTSAGEQYQSRHVGQYLQGSMSGLVQIGSQPAKPASACAPVRRSHAVLWLQTVTLAWMLIECGVSLYAAASAHSPSLLAFGSDSLVELLSAAVVLLQIRVTQINF